MWDGKSRNVLLPVDLGVWIWKFEGFISSDCGADEDYQGNTTNIFYNSDGNFVDSGENRNVSLHFMSDIFEKQLKNVRSFPEGVKNCYILQPEQRKDNKYLIIATFW